MKKLLIVLLVALTCVCLTLSACKKKAEEAAPATPPTAEGVAPAPEAAAPEAAAPEAAAPAPEAAAPAPEAATGCS